VLTRSPDQRRTRGEGFILELSPSYRRSSGFVSSPRPKKEERASPFSRSVMINYLF